VCRNPTIANAERHSFLLPGIRLHKFALCLSEVFNARDADSRRAAIDELWDKDSVFIDPGGVHEGVEKINAIVQLLVRRLKPARCSE